MTLEDIYKMAMTPLPPPPDLNPQARRLIDLIRGIKTPTVPDLPTMPVSWPQRIPEQSPNWGPVPGNPAMEQLNPSSLHNQNEYYNRTR